MDNIIVSFFAADAEFSKCSWFANAASVSRSFGELFVICFIDFVCLFFLPQKKFLLWIMLLKDSIPVSHWI